MLNKTPIDYVIWGNHEHDMSHSDVMQREKEYKGVWINSNMQSHESFKNSTCQVRNIKYIIFYLVMNLKSSYHDILSTILYTHVYRVRQCRN